MCDDGSVLLCGKTPMFVTCRVEHFPLLAIPSENKHHDMGKILYEKWSLDFIRDFFFKFRMSFFFFFVKLLNEFEVQIFIYRMSCNRVHLAFITEFYYMLINSLSVFVLIYFKRDKLCILRNLDGKCYECIFLKEYIEMGYESACAQEPNAGIQIYAWIEKLQWESFAKPWK